MTQKTWATHLKEWLATDHTEALDLSECVFETVNQARLLGQVLAVIPRFPRQMSQGQEEVFSHLLEDVIFLAPQTSEAYQGAMLYLIPEIRRLVDEGLSSAVPSDVDLELLALAIKLLLEAKLSEKDVDRLIALLRFEPWEAEESKSADAFCTSALDVLDAEHPYSLWFYRRVAEALPQGNRAVLLLEAANIFWNDPVTDKKRLKAKLLHPFDQPSGVEMLQDWLICPEPDAEDALKAELAAGALPFIAEQASEPLYHLAQQFPNAHVQIEAAWATLKQGRKDIWALELLQAKALDYRTSEHAYQAFDDLKLLEQMPAEAMEPFFRAKAEMYAGLMQTQAYNGAEPQKLDLVDYRIIYWPPSEEERHLSIFSYTFDTSENPELFSHFTFPHHGLVGSDQPASLGQLTENRSLDEIYALHCFWELYREEKQTEIYEDTEQCIQKGLMMLRTHNPQEFGA